MKYLLSLLALAVTLHPLHAGGTLKEARTRLLRGNYAEAQEIYADLAKDAKLRVRGHHRPEPGPGERRQL